MSGLTLVFATRSAHKVEELRRMVAPLEAAGLVVRSVADLEAAGQSVPEAEEDADTFAGNAEKKARAVAEATGMVALADDSGLAVDALGGRPGVYSARFAGVEGPDKDAANNARLLEELDGVPDSERGAAFVASLCLAWPDGRTWQVEGRCQGRIAHAPRGEGGFGYDPLFVSLEPGIDGARTHAELSPGEKDAVSHRGRALRALAPLLESLVRGEDADDLPPLLPR